MNLPNLTGKGLFVFSDPGGAKPILALAEKLKDSLTGYKIISDRNYSFYQDFSVEVNISIQPPAELISAFNPGFILTGTSYTSSIELEYIQASQKATVPVYSFVDHWTRIRERFQKNGREHLPDFLLLVDERAKKLAIGNGIEENRVIVFGNPYHSFLKKWKPRISRSELYQQLGLTDAEKKIVLYAPDPLSNVNGAAQYGFDEVSATKELAEGIKDCCDRFYCLLNPHPNQVVERLSDAGSNCICILPKGTDVNALIYYSSVVLGFFSNLLLEAIVMNKPVLRFFPKHGLYDPLEGKNAGEVVYPETISQKIKSLL